MGQEYNVDTNEITLCWLLRLSARKMAAALFLEHLIANKGFNVATSVHLYFKLPGGDKSKCTHWEKSEKLC